MRLDAVLWRDLQFGGVACLWAALLALGIDGLRRFRPWRQASKADLWLLVLAVLSGLALRLWAIPFPSDIRSAMDQGLFINGPAHYWSAGYSVFLHAVFAVFGPSFETAIRANIVVGSATIAALYFLGVLYLKDPLAALAGAAILATAPISARLSASDSAHVLLTLCLLLSFCFVILWARTGEWRWFAQACGWWILAANVRCEALVYAAALALVAVGAAPRFPSLARGAAPWLVLTAAGMILLASPVFQALAQRSYGAGGEHGSLWRGPWFLSPDSSGWTSALSVLGAGVLVFGPARRVGGLALLAAMAVVVFPAATPSNLAHNARYRHFLPVFAMFCLVAGRGLAAFIRGVETTLRRTWISRDLAAGVAPAAILLAALSSLPALGFLRKTWTHQLELAFVYDGLRRIDDGCTIVRRACWLTDSGLELSPGMSLQVGRKHGWVDTGDFLAGRAGAVGDCAVYYRSATCFAAPKRSPGKTYEGVVEELPECREMSKRYVLEPLAEAVLPAKPYVNEQYAAAAIPVGFYRIHPRRGGTLP